TRLRPNTRRSGRRFDRRSRENRPATARRHFRGSPTPSRSTSRLPKREEMDARWMRSLPEQGACGEGRAKGEGRRANGECRRLSFLLFALRLSPFAFRLGPHAMMRLPRFRYWMPKTAAVAVRIK